MGQVLEQNWAIKIPFGLAEVLKRGSGAIVKAGYRTFPFDYPLEVLDEKKRPVQRIQALVKRQVVLAGGALSQEDAQASGFATLAELQAMLQERELDVVKHPELPVTIVSFVLIPSRHDEPSPHAVPEAVVSTLGTH